MSKKRGFSSEDDEVLIEGISKFSAIYDAEHKDYKNMQAKDNIWIVVAELVGKSVEDCKKRWRDMRDNYFKIKKKKLPTGSAKSARPPKWPLYEQLNFLDIVKRKRKSRCSIPDDDDSKSNFDDNFSEERHTVDVKNDLTIDARSPNLSSLSEHPSGSSISRKRMRSIANISGGSTLTDCGRAFTKMIEGFEVRSQKRMEMLSNLSKNEEDDVDVFFRSIALTVKKLPPHLIAKAKLKVLSVVTELEALSSTPV